MTIFYYSIFDYSLRCPISIGFFKVLVDKDKSIYVLSNCNPVDPKPNPA